MDGIGGIRSLNHGPGSRHAASPAQAVGPRQAARSAGRSLVPVAPAPEAASGGDLPRPAAALLAQLMAARENLPQARRLRRAAPAEAIAAYRATAALSGSALAISADRRL